MRSHRSLLAMAAGAVAVLAACSPLAEYHASTRRPHKDALVVRVQLDRPLGLAGYERIAREELRLVANPRSSPDSDDLPLYDVRVEFLVSTASLGEREPVASVRYLRRVDGTFASPRIVLFDLARR